MKRIVSLMFASILMILLISCGKKTEQIGNKTFDVSKNYTICIAEGTDNKEIDAMRRGFVVGLKDLGLVEDINVTYYYENAKGNSEYAKQIAASFESKKPDLILSIGNTALSAIREKFSKEPIIFLGVANAERLGLCSSDGKPTSNATGVMDSHLFEEQLDFIRKNYTDKKKIGIIYGSDNALAQYDVDYLKFFATDYDIDIYTVSIKKEEDLDKALDNIMPKVDGLILVYDNIVNSNIDKVMARAKKDNKIVFGQTEEHKAKGALVSTLRDYTLVGKKGAEQAKAILVDKKKVSEVKVEAIDFKVN